MFGPARMVFRLIPLNGDKERSFSIICTKYLVSAALSICAPQSQLSCILPRSFARKVTFPKLSLLHVSPSFRAWHLQSILAFCDRASWLRMKFIYQFSFGWQIPQDYGSVLRYLTGLCNGCVAFPACMSPAAQLIAYSFRDTRSLPWTADIPRRIVAALYNRPNSSFMNFWSLQLEKYGVVSYGHSPQRLRRVLWVLHLPLFIVLHLWESSLVIPSWTTEDTETRKWLWEGWKVNWWRGMSRDGGTALEEWVRLSWWYGIKLGGRWVRAGNGRTRTTAVDWARWRLSMYVLLCIPTSRSRRSGKAEDVGPYTMADEKAGALWLDQLRSPWLTS